MPTHCSFLFNIIIQLWHYKYMIFLLFASKPSRTLYILYDIIKIHSFARGPMILWYRRNVRIRDRCHEHSQPFLHQNVGDLSTTMPNLCYSIRNPSSKMASYFKDFLQSHLAALYRHKACWLTINKIYSVGWNILSARKSRFYESTGLLLL